MLDSIAAERASQLEVVKLNIDENPRTTLRYQVLHVPTISLFSGGKVVRQLVGVRSRARAAAGASTHLI